MHDIAPIIPCEEGGMPKNMVNQQKNERTHSALDVLGEQLYRFSLGVVAGICGILVVYPIDSVKTRFQMPQRGSAIGNASGSMMYTGYWDCFNKVRKSEGYRAFYNGIGVKCLSVGPDLALKLTVNDLFRNFFRKDGVVPLPFEVLAGGAAGGCHVIFTNPLEITKIRMQLDHTATMKGTFDQIGFRGIYKGVSATLLRDIPYAAIYFPAYAHLKQYFTKEDGHLSLGWTLVAGFLAAIPSVGLTAPADLIKTRLQAKPVANKIAYKGLFDTASRITTEEGFTALWKGAGMRMLRLPPQFAITVFMYESFQRLAQKHEKSYSNSTPISSVHKPNTSQDYS